MTPHCPQPFYIRLILGVTGNALEIVEDIVSSHLAQTPQQIARVVEHNSRIATFGNKLGNKISHTAIAPGKRSRIVVIPFVGMFKHVLEIADEFALGTCRDGGLVHV